MPYNTYMPQNGYQPEYRPYQQRQEFMPVQQNMTQPNIGFVCRPVTSRSEADAVQCEYFAAGTLMPDLAHGTVYLKRFNQNTGTSEMFEFKLVQPETAPSPQYVTIEEFNAFKAKFEQNKPAGKVKKDDTD